MPTTTATKAKSSAPAVFEAPEAPEEQPIFGHYEELLAELEAAKARIAVLEAAPTEQLNQVLWLQKNPPGDRRIGRTADSTPYINFGAQYGYLSKKTNSRVFGAWKNFTAYGPLAEEISEFFRTEDRLVRITAYERPWHGTVVGADGPTTSRNSEWIVVSFDPIARLDAASPVSEPEAPFSAEPTAAEVAF